MVRRGRADGLQQFKIERSEGDSGLAQHHGLETAVQGGISGLGALARGTVAVYSRST